MIGVCQPGDHSSRAEIGLLGERRGAGARSWVITLINPVLWGWANYFAVV